MPKRAMELLTESMFYVLLAFRPGPCCGTELAERIDRLTSGRVRIGPATLYTLLGKFEKEKWIRETEVDGRRRTYRLTDRGEAAYRAELERLSLCVADAERMEKNGTEA